LQISKDVLDVPQGSLYPALYRLEHQGLIDAEWGESDNKRRAKFYTLTPPGENVFGKRRRLEPARRCHLVVAQYDSRRGVTCFIAFVLGQTSCFAAAWTSQLRKIVPNSQPRSSAT
jgi:DNA-binding PadR family transcriptional regulator